MTKIDIESTGERGAVVAGRFLPWALLDRAARQDDAELAAIYADIRARARRAEMDRVEHDRISAEWRTLGYPLRTGYAREYAGQCVSAAWETRRIAGGKTVAYIVWLDRSESEDEKRLTRQASPAFNSHDQAMAWVSANYNSGRSWHDETDGTAKAWLYD
jgi:hypothetical protein